MCSFCLLTSMELILVSSCSSLYFHSNDMNSLKSLSLERKVLSTNIIVIKTQIKSKLNQLTRKVHKSTTPN